MEQITSMLESNFSKVFSELSELRREIAHLKGDSNPSMVQRQVEKQMERPIEIQRPIEKQVEAKPNFHQRTGGFTPEDVSIEKIFYAGNK